MQKAVSKTDENIRAAFSGESQARNKYTYFAKAAEKEGYHYIAKIFEEVADLLEIQGENPFRVRAYRSS